MPDGTTRFTCRGRPLLHFMGTSTFSRYTVVADISVVAVRRDVPMDGACLLGCGVTTGYGAARVAAGGGGVEEGSTVAVFGAGCVGLSVVQGAAANGAGRIIVVDTNPGKEAWARGFGATDFVEPGDLPGATTSIQERLVEMTDGGCDYTFECTGNVGVMRAALEACHKGWGQSIIIGVAAAGQEIQTRRGFPFLFGSFFLPARNPPTSCEHMGTDTPPPPNPTAFQLVTGRVWRGCAFGGVKGRSQLPGLVTDYLEGRLKVDELITHRMKLAEINDAFEVMHGGDCIRAVVDMNSK